MVQTLRLRIARLLRRRGYLPLPGHDDIPPEPDSLLPFITAASIQGRVALGPDAGRPIDRYRTPPPDAPSFEPGSLCATEDGFSLHARVHIDAHDRERLEHLCRYITRPAIATERLSMSPDGKVVYQLRRPWRDGSPSRRPKGRLDPPSADRGLPHALRLRPAHVHRAPGSPDPAPT
jgi:hypothetical protein